LIDERRGELRLIFLAWGVVMWGLVCYWLASPQFPRQLLALYSVGYLLLGLLGHLLLMGNAPRADEIVFPLVYMLTGLGLMSVLRLRPELALRQFLWVFIGVACMGVAAGYSHWPRLAYLKYSAALVGLVLLVLTTFFGHEAGGARRWLGLGSFRFEPVELVKVLLVVFLAGYLSEARQLLQGPKGKLFGLSLPEPRYVGPLVTMWLLFMFVLVAQRDLGAAFLFYGIFQAMLLVATGNLTYLFAGACLAAFGAGAAYKLFSHVQVRFQAWWNPWVRLERGGYQIAQSLFSLGAGGIFGRGWGRGAAASTVPAIHTDFVFSSLAEELGLLGSGAVLFLYLFLVMRIVRSALLATDEFLQLLTIGIGSLFAIQAIVIIGGVIKMIPMTGITMPFVSYGGSSLISSYLLIGALLGISHGGE